MEQDTLLKLKQHTKEISDIMFSAQSAFKIVDYLYLETDNLKREVIDTNRFLIYTREIHWRIYVIEMSKLFTNKQSEHFNLHDFIKMFKEGNEFNIPEIDKYSIRIWEQNLLLEKKKIKNLNLQRNKKYGHTDRDRASVINKLSFADAKELIQVVQRIVSEIYIAVFDEVIMFDIVGEPIEDLKKIVDTLAEQKKEMLDFYRRHCKENGIDPSEVGL